jgi:hypothetical protein
VFLFAGRRGRSSGQTAAPGGVLAATPGCRPREVLAQPADELGVVLREVDLEVLALCDVVQAVADEDVVEVPERGDFLVVPAGGEEAADVLAVPALVDDLGRRQVRLGCR